MSSESGFSNETAPFFTGRKRPRLTLHLEESRADSVTASTAASTSSSSSASSTSFEQCWWRSFSSQAVDKGALGAQMSSNSASSSTEAAASANEGPSLSPRSRFRRTFGIESAASTDFLEDSTLEGQIPSHIYAAVRTRGTRRENDDVYSISSCEFGKLYCVFDGHGGQACAKLASELLSSVFEKHWRDLAVSAGEAERTKKRENRQGASNTSAANSTTSGGSLSNPSISSFSSLDHEPASYSGLPPCDEAVLAARAFSKAHDEVDSLFNAQRSEESTNVQKIEAGAKKSTSSIKASAVGEASSSLSSESSSSLSSQTSPSSSSSSLSSSSEGRKSGFKNETLNPPSKFDGIIDIIGSTATSIFITPSWIHVANVGDSRAILIKRSGAFLQLTVDHTPAHNIAERTRVMEAGGWLSEDGRVLGCLDMSRSLGDASFKAAGVSSQPSCTSHRLQTGSTTSVSAEAADATLLEREEDPYHFLVIATDGLWGVMENEHVATLLTLRGKTSVVKSGAAAAPTSWLDDSGSGINATSKEGGKNDESDSSVDPAKYASKPTSRGLPSVKILSERLEAEARLRGATDNLTVIIIDLQLKRTRTSLTE